MGWRGPEVSRSEICEVHLVVLPHLRHLEGSWVQTYLLLRVVGFQPTKKIILQDNFVHLSPYSVPWLENVRGLLSISGHDFQDYYLSCMLCVEPSLDIFQWLSKVFVNLLIEKLNLLYLFPHQRKCSHLQYTS